VDRVDMSRHKTAFGMMELTPPLPPELPFRGEWSGPLGPQAPRAGGCLRKGCRRDGFAASGGSSALLFPLSRCPGQPGWRL